MPTFKGTHITNFDATPPTVVDAQLHGGAVKYYVDAFECPDTANADIMHIFRVPVDSVPISLRWANDALGAGTVDIGLYRKNADGSYTAVDDDCFATQIAVTGANAEAEVLYEAAAANIDLSDRPLWVWAGLSARPAYNDFYVSLTFDTGTSTVATASIKLLVSQ